MRRLWITILTLPFLAVAGPAAAQASPLDNAAVALRSDPVYVDSSAELAPDVSADRLRQRIRQGSSPVFVAVLPAAATSATGGEPGLLPAALGRSVGLRGTYAVLVGNSFRAASNVLSEGEAAELATSSFQSGAVRGPQAVLEAFVDGVNEARTGPPSGGTDGGGGGGGGGGVLLLLALAGGGFFLWSRRSNRGSRQGPRREFEADRQLLQAELSVLGSDVLELEPSVTLHPEARADYDAGVTRYRSAQAAMDYADDQVDLVRVERVVDEGRYAMDRARARIAGREAPAPPEKLTHPGRHDEPALDVDERGQPVYVGYGGMPWYGGGWFGGGGGLLTGLMLGGMLGGGWSGGGWGGDGGDGGAEDFGGGDFGDFGGDFGGGDF